MTIGQRCQKDHGQKLCKIFKIAIKENKKNDVECTTTANSIGHGMTITWNKKSNFWTKSMIIQKYLKFLSLLFFSDNNLNDCDVTDFDLMKVDLDITMHPQDQIGANPADPTYVCFEKLEIVMDDDKRTTYLVNSFNREYDLPPTLHIAEMLPYVNYPSNLEILHFYTFL